MTKETTTTLILDHLDVTRNETRWASVSEIRAAINRSWSKIRNSLNTAINPSVYVITPASSDFRLFKSMKIPGDRHGRYQWALADADTTGWKNSAPCVSPSGKGSSPRRKKTPIGTTTGRISCAGQNLSVPPRSANSYNYKGLILMCVPANKPSLITAVGDLLINEFVTSGKKFSAYDVTKRLRQVELDRAKNATRNMPLPITLGSPVDRTETGETYASGYKVPKIDHEDVRSIVHDIYNAGGMPNLGRIQISNYWEYDIRANIDALLAASRATPNPVLIVPLVTSPDPVPDDGVSGSSYDGSSTV